MDLMYYQSPLYRTEIINGVIKSLNYVYQTFKENNPDFSGKFANIRQKKNNILLGPVSIVAHSLGSVIAYDILTNWSPFLLYDQFVSNAIAENMHCCTSDDQRQLLEQFYNSRKRLLDMGDLMEQILIRQEEPLKFHVSLICKI
jgi:phospholipase DDHD1